jgi:hypothetical protein
MRESERIASKDAVLNGTSEFLECTSSVGHFPKCDCYQLGRCQIARYLCRSDDYRQSASIASLCCILEPDSQCCRFVERRTRHTTTLIASNPVSGVHAEEAQREPYMHDIASFPVAEPETSSLCMHCIFLPLPYYACDSCKSLLHILPIENTML